MGFLKRGERNFFRIFYDFSKFFQYFSIFLPKTLLFFTKKGGYLQGSLENGRLCDVVPKNHHIAVQHHHLRRLCDGALVHHHIASQFYTLVGYFVFFPDIGPIFVQLFRGLFEHFFSLKFISWKVLDVQFHKF